MKIWIDGSGWNGKESKYSVISEDGKTLIQTFKEQKTNNEMEYMALIAALSLKAKDGDVILSDSALIVNQVAGSWKVKKAELFPLCVKAQNLLKEKNCILMWIGREENKAGHLLER
jgi:ribonuclease HI